MLAQAAKWTVTRTPHRLHAVRPASSNRRAFRCIAASTADSLHAATDCTSRHRSFACTRASFSGLTPYFLGRFIERLQHKPNRHVFSQQQIAVLHNFLHLTRVFESNTLTSRRLSRKLNKSSSFICAASFASAPLHKPNRREFQMRQGGGHQLIHQLIHGRSRLGTLQHDEQFFPERHTEIGNIDRREGIQDEHRLLSIKNPIITSNNSPLYALLSSIRSDKQSFPSCE